MVWKNLDEYQVDGLQHQRQDRGPDNERAVWNTIKEPGQREGRELKKGFWIMIHSVNT